MQFSDIELVVTDIGYCTVAIVVAILAYLLVRRMRRHMPTTGVDLTLTMPMETWHALGKLQQLSETASVGQAIERAVCWYDWTLRTVAAGSKIAVVDSKGQGTFIDVR